MFMDGITTYILIFNILLILGVNLAVWRDLKNPAVLHSLMWCSVVFLHRYLPHGLYQLESEVLWVIFFSMFVFSVGVFLGESATKHVEPSASWLVPDERLLNFYVLLSAVCLPLLVRKAISLASHGLTPNFFINLRMSLSNEDAPQSFGLLAYVLTVVFAALFLRLADARRPLLSFGVVVPAIICVCYALMGTGRTFFFLLMVPAFFIVLFTRPQALNVKNVVLFFGVLISVFVLIGQLLGKIDGEEKGALDAFSLYFFGGTSAFQEILSAPQPLEYGANTFRMFYAILAALGMDVPVKQGIQGYVYIPRPTNVYSVFQPYYLDFGLTYVFISQFAFGLLHSCLYSLVKKRYTIAVLLYSISLYPLFVQWFQDAYLSAMSQWIQFMILLALPLLVAHVRRSKYKAPVSEGPFAA